MKIGSDSPTVELNKEYLKNEKLYSQLVNRLDNLGNLVYWIELKPSTFQTDKERIYHVSKSTVRLRQTINTSLNQYIVSLRMGVYSNNERTARKVLREITDRIKI
jgi:transposase InsO family protein